MAAKVENFVSHVEIHSPNINLDSLKNSVDDIDLYFEFKITGQVCTKTWIYDLLPLQA